MQTYFSAYPGTYFTGDGCRRDEDGYYWITGRVDDVINVSGHRMGTAEVERARRAPEVAEAAVVGYPHDLKGQGIYCYVTLNAGEQGSDALRKELVGHVRKVIGPTATPDLIQFAPGLPKTRSGKIMRRILRKIAEDDLLQPRRHLDARRPARRRRPDRQPPEPQGELSRTWNSSAAAGLAAPAHVSSSGLSRGSALRPFAAPGWRNASGRSRRSRGRNAGDRGGRR